MLEAEREGVAAAARRLADAGLVIGTAGNISARAEELVAVSPTGAALQHLGASDIAVVDLDGTHVDGPRPATSELELHLGIYRRYGAGAVVHTHAPMATALACVLDELPVIHYQMLLLGGSVRVAPYETFGSTELAEATLDALQDRTAALMANHGAIVHGANLDGAMDQTLLLEWACGVYWHASALGRPRALDPEQQQRVVDTVVRTGYGRQPSR
ncbi:MAG TPA: class II aldolase/adducin family protein [Solirubrobacteraceae bacterium]